VRTPRSLGSRRPAAPYNPGWEKNSHFGAWERSRLPALKAAAVERRRIQKKQLNGEATVSILNFFTKMNSKVGILFAVFLTGSTGWAQSQHQTGQIQQVQNVTSYWIQKVEEDGRVIVLNTGHVLLVDPIDAVESLVWVPASKIMIFRGDNPMYPYKIFNVDENRAVNAKLATE
jgi:hypothetical protein